MNKNLLLILLLAMLPFENSRAQTYLPLTNNMMITGNSNIKIAAGNYSFTDSDLNGIIHVNNDTNVVIDGDSVDVDGLNYTGYMIYLSNCSNVVIKNFRSVKNYFYAVHAEHCDHLRIENCNFSLNRKDTVGWISIFENELNPNGGGIFLNDVRASEIHHDTAQYQNDGIAVYNCDSLFIHDNIFSWNTAYGIRMYHTDSSVVSRNNTSNINRITDPSDCAAILLYFSRLNQIIMNDFTASGDGIFTNANIYGPNSISNFHDDNYFAYNNCSGSPHNAIESVFTDGNVFKYNDASNSYYGIWAGYAINTLIDSNTILGNVVDGIAIEHGLNNVVSNNLVEQNGGSGFHCWADTAGVPPLYVNRDSHGNQVTRNRFNKNPIALLWSNTFASVVDSNIFFANDQCIQLNDLCANDSVHHNTFSKTVSWHIQNNSAAAVPAEFNEYATNDSGEIACRIYDYYDNPSSGIVSWQPFIFSTGSLIDSFPPADLCEPAVSDWDYFVADGLPTTLTWDSVDFQSGIASLKCITQSGFEVRLHYYPSNNHNASWDLSQVQTIHVSFKANNPNVSGFQINEIRFGNDCGDYFSYKNLPASAFTPVWTNYTIPLAGNATWTLSANGNVTWQHITYAEVIADTWDYGFTLWTDGLHFDPQPTLIDETSAGFYSVNCFPNPANESVNLEFPAGTRSIEIINNTGQLIFSKNLINENSLIVSLKRFETGIYFVRSISEKSVGWKKLVVAN